jgi:hypothetical protein
VEQPSNMTASRGWRRVASAGRRRMGAESTRMGKVKSGMRILCVVCGWEKKWVPQELAQLVPHG